MERTIRMRCTPSREELPLLQEQQVLYLLIELLPGSGGGEQSRLPLDVCLLLDCSSSMRGGRLRQAKEAATYIVNQLNANDSFCLIAFDDSARVIIPRQSVRAPSAFRQHIVELEAGGGTEMARGLEAALQQMQQHRFSTGVRRLILLTDGQTYGDDDRCVELARGAQKKGIGLTTLGLGEDWNEDLLATMAAHGSGRSEYIPHTDAIVPLFREEMRLLQGIMAWEMSISLRPAPQVEVRQFTRVAPEIASLAPRDSWDEGQTVPLGEWMGGDPQVFLTELALPGMPAGEHKLLELFFSYLRPRTRAREEERYELMVSYGPDVPRQSEVAQKVRQALEKVTAFRLQETAWQMARQGKIDQATRRLNVAATRLVDIGEVELARAVEEEARRLERTGRTSSTKKKEIHYGTRRLGRRRPGEE